MYLTFFIIFSFQLVEGSNNNSRVNTDNQNNISNNLKNLNKEEQFDKAKNELKITNKPEISKPAKEKNEQVRCCIVF
jgi:hypothetical protein